MTNAYPKQDLLKRLVEINSGSKNQDGVRQVQDIFAAELTRLGLTTRWLPGPDPAEILVAERKGQTHEWVTMVCHADTVFESDTDFLDFEMLDEVSARGPGVIDDKGSMIVLLVGLEKYFERTEKPVSIRVICTPTEELGSPGFSKTLETIGSSSRFGLGFEPALADGSIVHSRQGNLWYRITVSGKEGHAGRAYRESVNAAHELCLKLMDLQKLPGKSPLPTVNIGTIRAGEGKYNVVCGEAEAFVDVRVADRKQLEQVEKGVVRIFKKPPLKSPDGKLRAKVSFEQVDRCPPLPQDIRQKPWLARYLSVLKDIEGGKPTAAKSHGSSDCNYLGAHPIIIDGLGPRGSGLHTLEERIELPSIETRAEAVAQFLQSLEREKF